MICSLNTLLLNGNPLLRYDGYFVLADWLETPNLSQQRVKAVVSRFLRPLVSRQRSSPWIGTFLSACGPLVGIYGIASPLYRWCVVTRDPSG